jgi:hypothetical protein
VTDVAKKTVWYLVIAFAAFYLVTQPEGAADAVKTALDWVVGAFDAVVRFFDELSS